MVTRQVQKAHRADAECIVGVTTTNKQESSMRSRIAIRTTPVEGTLSDAEVVRRVLAGERAFFEELMRRYNQRVYRTIRGILRNEQEVEDSMQQTYLLAYAHLGEFAGASSFSTWLTRIAINEAYACLRKQHRLSVVDEIPDSAEDIMRSPPETPEHRAVAQESMRLIESAVDGLPLSHRTTFMLREVEQLSTAETSETLGITEEAVKTRLHRARLGLRDTLAVAVGQSAAQAFAFLAPRCDRVVAAVMAAIERVLTSTLDALGRP
jgi:RNA polymerase sigma-70 factor, ECF subfamily